MLSLGFNIAGVFVDFALLDKKANDQPEKGQRTKGTAEKAANLIEGQL